MVAATPDVPAQIVTTATRLFAARGFDGTSLQDIADVVGVTKQAVIHHFSSKEQVRRAVLDGILAHWNATLPALLLAATATEDRFAAVLGELHRFFAADPDRARVILREALDRPAEVKRLLEGPVGPWLGAVAGYIQRGQHAGQHQPDVDAEAYVVHVLMLVLSAVAGSAVMQAPLGPDARERYDRELFRIVRAALFPTPLPASASRVRATSKTRTKTGKTTKSKARLIMANFFTDNDDMTFYFDRGIDWASLVEVSEYGYRTPDGFKKADEAVSFYREVAQMVGELAADEIAPRAADIDRQSTHLEGGEAVAGPAMDAVCAALNAAEVHKLCLPRELGGLNAPLLLYFLNAEMIARADTSVMTHTSFHGGMAMAMLAYSLDEGTTEVDVAKGRIEKTRFAAEIDEISRGVAWGCMDITEPNAGSDMAALRTRGEQDANGDWTVTGQKIFITSGHGKYHFVIARTEDAKDPNDPFGGLAGLSMFLVKTYDDLEDGTRRRYVTLDRVEEKLGHHGSVTAALSFDKAPARLIGKRGEGFRYMLTLMNNARVGVGFESLGLAEGAYRMAVAYAEERKSMGKPIARHEMIADMLDEMRTDLQAIRALAVASSFHEEMSQKLRILSRFAEAGAAGDAERARIERELPKHRALARRYTPLLKYLASEKSVEIARRNVQIHGGVGYTKDYGAEKLLRDALVLPIYEGTSQIQSLMAMKDTLLGILKRPQAFVTKLGQARFRSMSARDPLERRVARVQSLSLSAQQHLLTRTAAGKLRSLSEVPVGRWRDVLTKEWDPKRDFSRAMLHAERLTRLLADEAICELLLAQAKAHPDRRDVLERYLDRAELRARALHEEITTTGDRILASLAPAADKSAEAAE